MRIRLVLAAFVLGAGPAAAQVYKWVDERGITHYSERPPVAAKAMPTRKLDITLRGNDPPASEQECSTIRCQYERLRRDRLLREADRREEEDTRARVAALTPPPAVPSTPATSGVILDPYPPIYGRPITGVRPLPLPVPLPTPRPLQPLPAPEPSVAIGNARGSSGIGR
jgi:hypothetical protein